MIDSAILEHSSIELDPDPRSPTVPHALCLNVFLSEASFSHVAYEKGLKTVIRKDIKIDVYFNGQFVNSQIVNRKQYNCSGSRGMKARIVRFAGQKLSRMIEKPWIFTPPNQNAGGISDDSPPSDEATDGGMGLRWTAISNELLVEANKACRDECGERLITGDYLENLALLPMPSEVEEIQKVGNVRFGVIDVVVLWGSGQKDGPDNPYLTKPTRMRGKRDSAKLPDSPVCDPRESHKASASSEHDPTGATVPILGASAAVPTESQQVNKEAIPPNADQSMIATFIPRPPPTVPNNTPVPPPVPEIKIPPKTRSEALATASALDGSSDQSPKSASPLIRELFPPARSGTSKRSRTSSISSQPSNPPKRRRAMQYHHVVTTKRTLAEQLESIVEKAVKEVHERRASLKIADAPQVDVVDSSPLSSVSSSSEEVSLIEVPKPSKIVTLRVSPQKLGSSPDTAGVSSNHSINISPSKPMLSQPFGTSSNLGMASSPVFISPNADGKRAETTLAETTTATPLRPRKRSSQVYSNTEAFDAGFQVPKLSENCCVTYAEPGVVRNVGAVRGGWFEEEGVIMGTRFIIG